MGPPRIAVEVSKVCGSVGALLGSTSSLYALTCGDPAVLHTKPCWRAGPNHARRASRTRWPRRRGRKPRTCAFVQRTASLTGRHDDDHRRLMLSETVVRAHRGRSPGRSHESDRPFDRGIVATPSTRIPGGSVAPVVPIEEPAERVPTAPNASAPVDFALVGPERARRRRGARRTGRARAPTPARRPNGDRSVYNERPKPLRASRNFAERRLGPPTTSCWAKAAGCWKDRNDIHALVTRRRPGLPPAYRVS